MWKGGFCHFLLKNKEFSCGKLLWIIYLRQYTLFFHSFFGKIYVNNQGFIGGKEVIMNIDNLWDNFLEKIKPKISSLSYDTWFKNTKLVSLDNNVAKILVDSPLQKKSLQETWYQTISDVFSEITNTSFDFEFVFEDEVKTNTIIPVENIGVPLNTPEKSNLNNK